MASKRNKPNYSMFLPKDVRDDIDKLVQADQFSSVAAFLIASARINLNCIKSLKS